MLEKIDGIIIKTHDYGETHKIVTLLSEKHGKISALARGAKKPKSRMAAVTQPFIYGTFFIYLSKGLSTMQQGEVLHSLRGIREDIMKTAYAAYIVELTDKLLDKNEADVFIFNQLYQTLVWIEEKEDDGGAGEIGVPMLMYELKLFQKAGFAPIIDRCVQCGRKQFPYYFSVAEGGFLCQVCKDIDESCVFLPDVLAKWLYMFLHVGLERVGTISMKPENKKLLRNLIDAYYEQYGGFFLKSKKFLRQVDRLS